MTIKTYLLCALGLYLGRQQLIKYNTHLRDCSMLVASLKVGKGAHNLLFAQLLFFLLSLPRSPWLSQVCMQFFQNPSQVFSKVWTQFLKEQEEPRVLSYFRCQPRPTVPSLQQPGHWLTRPSRTWQVRPRNQIPPKQHQRIHSPEYCAIVETDKDEISESSNTTAKRANPWARLEPAKNKKYIYK